MKSVLFNAIVMATLCGCTTFERQPGLLDRPMADSPILDKLGVADLAIGDDEVYRRPNAWSELERDGVRQYAQPVSRTGVSIAWRNANQIEEVEVRVVNLGEVAGRGRLSVDIVSHDGDILLSLAPPVGQEIIDVPAASEGGLQGRVVRMQASWDLNGLIDRFDLSNAQYGVMATIMPIGEDANPYNNRKTKTWHNMSRVVPGGYTTFNYQFTNFERATLSFKKVLETSHLPPGWKVTDLDPESAVTLRPGESMTGTLQLEVPGDLEEGAFAETRLSLVDAGTGAVYRQHEWFEVHDTILPDISNYRVVLLADHTIAIQALVADQHSGVMEATGVSTEYSVDQGRTWARKAHNYKTGNFVRPTLFETVLGPFQSGTEVWLRMTARDTAGNAAMKIPPDGTAFRAPSGAEQLIQFAYIFPRTKANPIFEVEELRALADSAKRAKERGIDIRSLERDELEQFGLSAERIADLGLDPARLEDLKSDLHLLGMMDFEFDEIDTTLLEPQVAPGESILPVNTFSVSVQ